MLPVAIALAAHALNAFVFVIDKAILGVREAPISRPVRYAAYSGLTAAAAAGLLPFVYAPPTVFIAWASLWAGGSWVAALWFFFTALKRGEPSRVVPITGAAVPLFTLIFAAVFLGERLSGMQLLGVLGLMAGGALLSVRLNGSRGLPATAAAAAIASGAAFAAHFAIMDFVYDRFTPFLAAFAYTRLGVGFVALLLLGWLAATTSRLPARRSAPHRTRRLAAAFFTGKGIGTAALLLQNYAISLGSVTVVNALQGFQYVFLLALAAGVSHVRPQYFREEWTRVAAWQKIGGVLLVLVGLVLVV